MRSRRPARNALQAAAIAISILGAERIRPIQTHDEIVVLQTDGRLVVFDAVSGLQRAETALLTPRSTDRVGSIAAGRGEVFVSKVNRANDSTTIVAVSLADLSARRLAVIRDSVGYPLIAVGPKRGLVYAVADHQVHVVVVDPATGDQRWRAFLPRDAARDWLVYSIGMPSNEARLYLSYHGMRSSGIDWLDLTQMPPRSCDRSRPLYPSDGCIASHGNFAPLGAGLVAATGEGVVLFDSLGASVKHYSVGLSPPNHFMEFALDTSDAIVYGIGSCLSQGGLTKTSLRGDATPAAIVRQDANVCGGAVLLSADKTRLFVSRDRTRSDLGPGEITVVDLARGVVAHRIALSGKVVGFVEGLR